MARAAEYPVKGDDAAKKTTVRDQRGSNHDIGRSPTLYDFTPRRSNLLAKATLNGARPTYELRPDGQLERCQGLA